jgi:hypothetical protein
MNFTSHGKRKSLHRALSFRGAGSNSWEAYLPEAFRVLENVASRKL